jgi:hypothetical protein
VVRGWLPEVMEDKPVLEVFDVIDLVVDGLQR